MSDIKNHIDNHPEKAGGIDIQAENPSGENPVPDGAENAPLPVSTMYIRSTASGQDILLLRAQSDVITVQTITGKSPLIRVQYHKAVHCKAIWLIHSIWDAIDILNSN